LFLHGLELSFRAFLTIARGRSTTKGRLILQRRAAAGASTSQTLLEALDPIEKNVYGESTLAWDRDGTRGELNATTLSALWEVTFPVDSLTLIRLPVIDLHLSIRMTIIIVRRTSSQTTGSTPQVASQCLGAHKSLL
jgi:hypothetical protein